MKLKNESNNQPMNAGISKILADRAQLLAKTPEEETPETQILELLTFRRGDERYGLDMHFVKEVQPLINWTFVPCTPAFIFGALNLRGRVYSITDIGSFFGLPSVPPLEEPYVVLVEHVGDGSLTPMTFCLLADELPVVQQFQRDDLLPPQEVVSDRSLPYVHAATRGMLIYLNMEILLSDPAIIVDYETSSP